MKMMAGLSRALVSSMKTTGGPMAGLVSSMKTRETSTNAFASS